MSKYPVFPIFDIEVFQESPSVYFILAAGGGGNPLFGKSNGVVMVSESTREDIDFYESKTLVTKIQLRGNILTLIFEDSFQVLKITNRRFKNFISPGEEGSPVLLDDRVILNNLEYVFGESVLRERSTRIPLNTEGLLVHSKNIICTETQLYSEGSKKRYRFNRIYTCKISGDTVTLNTENNMIYIFTVDGESIKYLHSTTINHQLVTCALFKGGKVYYSLFDGALSYKCICIPKKFIPRLPLLQCINCVVLVYSIIFT